jgi:hypothetical protein
LLCAVYCYAVAIIAIRRRPKCCALSTQLASFAGAKSHAKAGPSRRNRCGIRPASPPQRHRPAPASSQLFLETPIFQRLLQKLAGNAVDRRVHGGRRDLLGTLSDRSESPQGACHRAYADATGSWSPSVRVDRPGPPSRHPNRYPRSPPSTSQPPTAKPFSPTL